MNPQGWRRARAMLQNDQTKELRRRFLLTCVQRNRNAQLRLKALGEIADLRDPEAFDDAIDIVGTWSREDKRAGTKTLLQALVDKRIGRRDQAQAWVWRLASYTRELHEEYAVQRWPETKRLLGLLVNSSGRAHGRNARRLVHAARKQDRRLAVALLAGAVSHTPEGEEVLRGARMRMARKPSAIARELLRNFPKGGKRRASAASAAAGAGRERREAAKRAPRARRGRKASVRGRRWTSPAPRTTRSPPVATTTRFPRSSTPSATPEPPSQAISRPRRASRSARGEDGLAARPRPSGQGVGLELRLRSRRGRRGPRALEPKIETAVSRSSGGNSSGSIVRLRPTPITAQSSCGRASIRMPGQLAAVEQDVVRPLDPALDARLQLLGRLADGERDGKRQQQVALVERAQDRRVEERLAGRRGPGCVPGARGPRSARRR